MSQLKEFNGLYYKECDILMLQSTHESNLNGDELWINVKNELKISKPNSICPFPQRFQHLYFLSDEEIRKGDWFTNGSNIFQCMNLSDVDPKRYNYLKKIISSTDKSLNLPVPSKDFLNDYAEEYNKGNQIKKVLVECIKLDNIYITQDDLVSLNCTDFTKVSSKYGFKYFDDFWNAMNETLFLIDGYNVYNIKIVQYHDIYHDYLKGDFLFEITEFEKNYQLNVSSYKIINTLPQKESWNRDDIKKLIIKLKSLPNEKQLEITDTVESFDKWIEENL